MSELKTDVVEPFSSSTVSIPLLDTSSLNVESPIKAWAAFSSTGVTSVLYGENVMGSTFIAAGKTLINLSIVLPDTDYVLAGMAGLDSNSSLDLGVYNNETAANTTTSFTLNTISGNSLAGHERSGFAVIAN